MQYLRMYYCNSFYYGGRGSYNSARQKGTSICVDTFVVNGYASAVEALYQKWGEGGGLSGA